MSDSLPFGTTITETEPRPFAEHRQRAEDLVSALERQVAGQVVSTANARSFALLAIAHAVLALGA